MSSYYSKKSLWLSARCLYGACLQLSALVVYVEWQLSNAETTVKAARLIFIIYSILNFIWTSDKRCSLLSFSCTLQKE